MSYDFSKLVLLSPAERKAELSRAVVNGEITAKQMEDALRDVFKMVKQDNAHEIKPFKDSPAPEQASGAGALLGGVVVGGLAGFALGGPIGAGVGALLCGVVVLNTACEPVVEVNVNLKLIMKKTGCSQSEAEILQQILEAIKAGNTKVDTLIQAMQDLGKTIGQIMVYLINLGEDAATIIKLLQENNLQNEQIIDALARGNEDIKKYLDSILTAVREGNALTEDTNKLLTEILNKLASQEQYNNEQINILKDALAKLDQIIKNQETANDERKKENEKVVKLLTQIIELMEKGNKDQIKVLQSILNALNKLGDNDKKKLNLLEKMMAKLDQIIKNQKTADENRKKENEAVTNLLQAILDKMDQCGEDMSAKLDAIIGKIDLANINLGNIETILKEIAAQFPEVKDKLQEILDKIPEGCHCDIGAVIAEIQKIIVILINQNDGNTHEGVIDDEIDWSGLEGLLNP